MRKVVIIQGATAIAAVIALIVSLWVFRDQISQVQGQTAKNTQTIHTLTKTQNQILCRMVIHDIETTKGPHIIRVVGDPQLKRCIEKGLKHK